MQRMLAALPLVFLLTGCLAAKLKGPAEDHYVQTRAITDRCIDTDGESACDDLIAMCDQAEAISAIARGKEAVGCHGEGVER